MEKENLNEQELIYRFSIFERQIQELQQQIESIDRGIVELNTLALGLDDLVGKTNAEIYAPLGRGIFVKAKLISEELNVDIGNGNIIKKNIPDTKKLIEEQRDKLQQVKDELEKSLEEIGAEMTNMMNAVQGHSHEHCHCAEGEECDCGDECNCEKED
jgi:prefoldin alpha subunit